MARTLNNHNNCRNFSSFPKCIFLRTIMFRILLFNNKLASVVLFHVIYVISYCHATFHHFILLCKKYVRCNLHAFLLCVRRCKRQCNFCIYIFNSLKQSLGGMLTHSNQKEGTNSRIEFKIEKAFIIISIMNACLGWWILIKYTNK